jgi:hypothetical protein
MTTLIINKPGGAQRTSERGNVLFLILIAVALFAALSYAVTQSTRSGGGDAGRETNLVNSSTITQYPASIKTAIVRMIVSNGASAETLEFNPPSAFGTLTSTTLGVFHPAGGGATYALAPNSVVTVPNQTWHFNGENQVDNIGLTNGAAAPNQASADLIAFLPNVRTAICTQIHTQLGLSTTLPTEASIVITLDQTNAHGTLLDRFTETGNTIGDGNILSGQPQGCFVQGGINVYYHVLVER